MNNILKLHNSWKTVFKKREVKSILWIANQLTLDKFIHRALKDESLKKLHYGIYALWKYDIYELGTKIKQKSYISLETSLKDNALIFQYYDSIFLLSDDTLEKTIWGQKYVYKKMKDSILLNPIGIEHMWNYAIAGKERAICDTLYFRKNYYFDSLEWVNFEKLEKISQIYNKRVQKEIQQLIKEYAG